ncbi:MAG TPA: MerR family transcriptional regulator [Blastocatellia bacterium]
MPKLLQSVQTKKFVGVAELADQAAKMLGLIAPVQERGTVTEVPDERTVRYYLNEGLISPAEEKQGTSSVFGYRHLLQLLAVKKLQSEHLPIRKILELVPNRENRDLERLLGFASEGDSGGENEATRYLESLLVASSLPPGAAHPGSRPQPPEPPAQPKGHSGGVGPRRIAVQMAMAHPPSPPAPMSQQPREQTSGPMTMDRLPTIQRAVTWDRIEIQPGLELHVRSDYRPPAEPKDIRALARLITDAIEAFNNTRTQ